MAGAAYRDHAFLGAALVLVTPGTGEACIELVKVERLLEPLGLPHVGMKRPVIEWIDPPLLRFGILVDKQLDAILFRNRIAEFVHGLKLPCRIDVEQGERDGRGVESLARQVKQYGGILAHRIQHDRVFALGHDLTQDVNAFGLEHLEMAKRSGHATFPSISETASRVTWPMKTRTGAPWVSLAARCGNAASGLRTST